MHRETPTVWKHSHTFGQDLKRPGEARTLIVIGITAAMMAIEVVAGVLFGSMALLADGLHMASHAAALSVNAFAYAYARRHARDRRYSFGTGKVNALGGFSGALLLALFSLSMAWESLARFVHPVEIVFNQAILVAFLGLVVNGVCVFILGGGDRDHPARNRGHGQRGHSDHNLKSAYLHVMADALTSVLAIFALLAAKYFGFVWMDPGMGVVGAFLVARWSVGLLRTTSAILLDRQGPQSIRDRLRESVERDGTSRVSDLHLWGIGPGVYAAILVVVAQRPATAEEYKARIPKDLGLGHVTVEVHSVGDSEANADRSRAAPAT